MQYERRRHAAKSTDDFVFSQLIPYIGNKRKLLDLIGSGVRSTGIAPGKATFFDAFAGSGVVSRYAKALGFRVLANDWEPYAEAINGCSIGCNRAPVFFGDSAYADVIERLNALPPTVGWVTEHLCPEDDRAPDLARDRMFFMRKNGMRIDAIRGRLREWEDAGRLTAGQRASLLAPLLYQACYTSNTSGVFKGFHNGWGGQTRTALYRIGSTLSLSPAVFVDNRRDNQVLREDATALAHSLAAAGEAIDIAYLDPPYNQHPYGSNYHVLNTIALWDSPALSRRITGRGDKAAIRTDWRTERRSAYNRKAAAAGEYLRLLDALNARWVITSYSTDGNIDLEHLLAANTHRGDAQVFLRGYKRYRVSSQRFSEKPVNVELVVVTQVGARPRRSADELHARITAAEAAAVSAHPELRAAQGR